MKYGDNGKAFFRVGQALHHLGRNEKALNYLEQAVKLLPNDATSSLKYKTNYLRIYLVSSYLDKVRNILGSKDKENSIPNNSKQTNENKNQTNLANEKNLAQTEKESSQIPNERKKENEQKKDIRPPETKVQKDDKKDLPIKNNQTKNEVIIEEEKKAEPLYEPSIANKPSTLTNPAFGNDPNKLSQAKQSAEQLKSMNPEQLKMMTDYFQNMDNSFLKQMMKQQTGVEMSESELQNIKGMMNPDMLKMMSEMNFDSMPGMGNMGNMPMNMNPSTGGGGAQATPSMASMASNIGNLMQNKDMINGMMENMKKNPEMLKSMGKMFGENSKISDMISKSSPEDLQKMMTMMQGVVGFFGKIGAMISWMKRNKIFMIFLAIMAFIYFFYL